MSRKFIRSTIFLWISFFFPYFSLNISVLRAPCEICSVASFYCQSQGSPWTILHFPSRPFTRCLGATHPASQWVCDSAFSLGQVQLHAIGQFLFQGPDEKDHRSFCSFRCLYIDVVSLFLLQEKRTGVGRAEEGDLPSAY